MLITLILIIFSGFQSDTYLIRLADSEISRYKGNANYQQIGKSPFFVINSNSMPTIGSSISLNNNYQLANWYTEKIQTTAAHAKTRGHSSTIIAIIDSGTDLNIAEFKSSYWINNAEDINNNNQLDSLDLNGIDDDGNGIIDDVIGYDFVDTQFESQIYDFKDIDPFPDDDFPISGHGTPIVDLIRQVAPEVKLMILKAADANGLLQEDDIARAIIYAQENGAHVINLSFGNTIESPFLKSVIDYVTDLGVICVASSGNSSANRLHFPAAFQSVIAVGNSNEFDERSSSSNYGTGLDLLAPGTALPVIGRFNNTYEISGTSFSAPLVAATAALVLDVLDLNPAEMKEHLKLTSDDISTSGYDLFTGAGRLNANKAVHQISHNQLRIISPPDYSSYKNQNIPLIIDANGTHIGTVEVTVYSDTKIVFKNEWQNRLFYSDSIFELIMTDLDEGDYYIEIATSLYRASDLIVTSRFKVDRSPPGIIKNSSGPILNKDKINFYLEYELNEDAAISFSSLPDQITFRQSNNSGRFKNRVFQEIDFADLAGQTSLLITLSDQSSNVTLDTIDITGNLGFYERPFDFKLTNLGINRSVVSDIMTDLDNDNRPEFWLSRYQIGLKLDSTFVVEQQTDLSFQTVASYQIQSVLRDKIDTNNDGLVQLLFGYSDQVNIVNQDLGFQLSNGPFLNGAGIGTAFVQSTEPLVALRTATRYNLYNIHLVKQTTELVNFADNPNFLDIPKLAQTANSIFFADKTGNILWYKRNEFEADTVLTSTYPEGSHTLYIKNRKLYYLGALIPNITADDNAYQQSRRLLQQFDLDLRLKSDSLMIRDFTGDHSDAYINAVQINLIDYLIVNVSGQLYLLTTDFEPIQYLGEANGYSAVSSANMHIFSRKDSVYSLEFNPQVILKVNNITIRQGSDTTIVLDWTASDLYQTAYIYKEVNSNLLLVDSTALNQYTHAVATDESARYAIQLKSFSQSSKVAFSETIMIGTTAKISEFKLLENRYLEIRFDKDLNKSRLNLANYQLQSGQIQSLFSKDNRHVILTIEFTNTTDVLTTNSLKDYFGRPMNSEQITFQKTETSQPLKVLLLDFTSSKEFVLDLNTFLETTYSVTDLDSEQLLNTSFQAGQLTVKAEYPFRHGKHYSFKLSSPGQSQFFGFTYNSEIADIILFPNPFIANRHEYLSITNIPESSQLMIFSLTGKRIFLKEFFSATELYNLYFKTEIGYQPATGIYFWVLKTGETIIRGKFAVIN